MRWKLSLAPLTIAAGYLLAAWLLESAGQVDHARHIRRALFEHALRAAQLLLT